MKLFKKKTDEEKYLKKAIKKLPRKRRKKSLLLLEDYKKGIYLRPGEEIDNKKLMEDIKHGKVHEQIQKPGV